MLYTKYNAWVKPLNNGNNPYTQAQIGAVQHMLQDDLIRKHIALNMLSDGIASNDTAAILIGLSGGNRYI